MREDYGGAHRFLLLKLGSGGDVIDATRKGSRARFMNHSCAPNCIAIEWRVGGELVMGMFARKDIRRDEELTFAYDKGIIDWPAYQRQMATFCGMAAEDLTTGADPWNKEERLLALTGGTPSTEFGKDPRGGGI